VHVSPSYRALLTAHGNEPGDNVGRVIVRAMRPDEQIPADSGNVTLLQFWCYGQLAACPDVAMTGNP
jgi:hypothetical protein